MTDAEFEAKVLDILESNRQWLREHNMAHAKFQMRGTKDPGLRKLWAAVLDSYGQLTLAQKGFYLNAR